MTEYRVKSPVAFLIFNRPDTTERVFAEISKAKPSKLLVVADGPRSDRTGEDEKCAAARAVIDRVDWDCDVLKNYSDTNLGCKKRVSSGIDWVFENVEEAIILEDDCLPNQSFFRFCDEMLDFYRDDEKIMQISGANLLSMLHSTEESYLISRYGGIWGWATWKRAWSHYDVTMKKWKEKKTDMQWLRSVCETKSEQQIRIRNFNLVYENGIDTWDFQWIFCKLLCNGMSIIPKANLIENIGFGIESTHTSYISDELYKGKRQDLNFPLDHLSEVKRNYDYDTKYSKQFFKADNRLVCFFKSGLKKVGRYV